MQRSLFRFVYVLVLIVLAGLGIASLGSSISNSVVIARGTVSMPTANIGSNACSTVVIIATAGVLTTDTVSWSYNAAVGVNPGELVVNAWPTVGNVNFQYCDPASGGVTPVATTLNWRVIR